MIKTVFRRFVSKVLIDKKEALKKFPKLVPEKRTKRVTKITQEIADLPLEREIKHNQVKLVNVDTIKPQLALRMIDTSLDSFFAKRKPNSKNFNFLLLILSEKKDLVQAELVFEKMDLFGVKKYPQTYANMISNCAKNRKEERMLYYYNLALNKFDLHIVTVNAIIDGYSKLHKPDEAEIVFKEALRNNLRIDTAIMTSLINAFNYSDRIEKCWELYDSMDDLKIPKDDALIGFMIRICSVTQESEKAIKMWNEMKELDNVRYTCLHYNAIIRACASRKDYCERAIEYFDEMIQIHKIQPDGDTFINVMDACGKIGNVKRAYEAILMMNDLNLKPTKYVYSTLIGTYATAIRNPAVPHNLKTMYYEDSWKIFQDFVTKQGKHVDARVLNSLMNVCVSFDKLIDAEEIVIPLFEQYGVKINKFTYETLLKGLHEKKELMRIKDIYNKLKNNESQLTVISMNIILDTFFNLKDVDGICEILDIFKVNKKHPPRKMLRKLHKIDYLPHAIYFRIMKFDYMKDHPLLKMNARTIVNDPTAEDIADRKEMEDMIDYDSKKDILVEVEDDSEYRHFN